MRRLPWFVSPMATMLSPIFREKNRTTTARRIRSLASFCSTSNCLAVQVLKCCSGCDGNLPLNRLPVVMLTSSRHSVDINRAYDLGANSYLSKPETASQLEQLATRFQSYWLGINESPDLLGNVAKLSRS